VASFPSIRIEGGLLGPELLDQIVAADVLGQKPADFGLDPKRNLTDEIAAAFADSRALWGVFQNRLVKLSEEDLATSVTRDTWVIPFLGLLGYELTYNQRAYEVDGQSYAISHAAGAPSSIDTRDSTPPPVHIVGARQELGRVPTSGRPRLAPHSLVQEYLNRTEHVWGIATNGLTLRLLRDSTLVRRQAYVEFDIQAILDEQRFHDFAALYRLLHRSRLPRGMADANECLLEKYYGQTIEQGGRVREHLRDGVEECLKLLGNGFLAHPNNEALRQKLKSQQLLPAQFYRQLFRLVYRFLFLLVSEDRGLISTNSIYRDHYGIARLRRMLDVRAAWTDHPDLWLGLRTLFTLFQDDKLSAILNLAPLNGELFATQTLDGCMLSNRDLLTAFWHLAYYEERAGAAARRVNYAALDVEELGSVYESLLEFHPDVAADASGQVKFDLIFGSERKTTGSFYTPPELVNELIESALVPVIKNRLASAEQIKNQKSKIENATGALLSLKIIDVACGSGHMLLAAARRVGKELSKLRTGEEEPAPERVRESIRDVISHCIYGVDRNPLAVDLCRVALWLESHTAGKPLTFLDHRIRCGDSLVGVFDLSVLKNGIPDKAFDPCEGDDKTVARAAVKKNKEERRGAQDLFALRDSGEAEALTQHSRDVDAIPDDSPELIRRKKELFEASHRDPAWRRQKQACDLWTAAFFQNLAADSIVITSAALADHLSGRPIDSRLHGSAGALAVRQPFFHWPLEFPEVFAQAGFDVILSNPPWERIKLQEQEFFAGRDPSVADAPNKAARARLIKELAKNNPSLYSEFNSAVHTADCASKFLRESNRFPLTATGDINTYALFTELSRCLVNSSGRAGVIAPTGIVTDDTTKAFFKDLVEKQALVGVVGYENESFIFPSVHHSFKFCALTLAGKSGNPEPADFVFLCRRFEQARDLKRHFQLTPQDLETLNPNTGTCPVFRTRKDAELTKKIYQKSPVLLNERTGDNPWGVYYMRMVDLGDHAQFVRFPWEERSADWDVPLYEAKLIWAFDHRYATFAELEQESYKAGLPRSVTTTEKVDPNYIVNPRYYLPRKLVSDLLAKFPEHKRQWLLVWRDVTSSVVERTCIATAIPKVGATRTCPGLGFKANVSPALLLANLNSLPFDYATRQKIGGNHLSFNIFTQLPVLRPDRYSEADKSFVVSRTVELVYTAFDIQAFAEDILDEIGADTWNCWFPQNKLAGAKRPNPFRWDEARRALLRAELDAWFARAYGLTRDELRYILDPADVHGPDFPSETFRVLKDKEIAKYGEYRTRRLVMEAWDRNPGGPPSLNS
jgi:hypothetical protein